MNAISTKPKEVFLAALKVAPDQWEAYVSGACGGDDELRRRVTDLLQAHAAAGSFLEAPDSHLVATVDRPLSEGPGTIIGAYTLREQIGEGGMGLVFVAEQQQPVRRKVALKVIKPGLDSHQVIARFEAERQALALMDHPNIAKVLDGGETASGRPYFVMELVKGVSLTDYCDQNRLTTRQRLELFLPVCHAVQHAHQKGIIHRDLKPANILVTVHDVTPVVKVIDFGIAKATGEQLTDKTLYTSLAQLVGTPQYMSPEQAGLSGLDVDTRSDIYALGVLLYELLTGTTPFETDSLRKAGYDEMRRIIREDEPPKPSTRLRTLQKDTLSTVCERRSVDLKKLSQQVRGELDWIVMKCLEKDRNRRYESATGFAADVQRYLNDEPVQACPPSARYRLRKFARQNKAALVTGCLVAAALLIGTAVSVWQTVEANRARQLADVRLANEEQAHSQAQSSYKRALQAVDRMLVQVDEKMTSPQLEMQRQRLLEDAAALYTDLIAVNPSNGLAWVDHMGRGKIYMRQKKYAAALSDYSRAIELNPFSSWAYKERALIHCQLGHHAQALADIVKAVELDPDLSNLTSISEAVVASCPDESLLKGILELTDRTIERLRGESESGDRVEAQAGAYASRAKLHEAMKHPDLARADFDRVIALFGQTLERQKLQLGPDHSTTLNSMNNLAHAYTAASRPQEAAACYRKVIRLRNDSPDALNIVAWFRATCPNPKLRDATQAVELARKAVQLRPWDGTICNTLGVALYRAGDWKAAISTLEKSMGLRKGGDCFDWFFLAMAHWKMDQKVEARKWYDQAVQWMDKNKPQDEELIRFRAEAAELLGVPDKLQPRPLKTDSGSVKAPAEIPGPTCRKGAAAVKKSRLADSTKGTLSPPND